MVKRKLGIYPNFFSSGIIYNTNFSGGVEMKDIERIAIIIVIIIVIYIVGKMVGWL